MSATNSLIDWEQLEAIADGWPEDFVEIYHEFLKEIPADLARLNAAVASADCSEASALAHRIKGSAANFGFVGVQNAALDLEVLARQGTLQGASLILGGAQQSFAAGVEEVKARVGH